MGVYIPEEDVNEARSISLMDFLEQRGIQAVPQYPPAGCKDVNDYLVGMNMLQTDRGKKLEAGL